MGRSSARRRNRPNQQARHGHHVSCFLAARAGFGPPHGGPPVRKICGIFAALIAVLGVSWLLLHRKNESQSVSVASPENPAPLQQAGSTFTYNFDSDSVGLLPKEFHSARTGQGPSSRWVVLADSTAPSKPNVVAQTSVDATDYRFPLLIADEGSFRDLEVTVRFKAVSGDMDQAGGLAFRLKDANNYYIARANGPHALGLTTSLAVCGPTHRPSLCAVSL